MDKDVDMRALIKSLYRHGIIDESIEVNDNTLINIVYILYLKIYIYCGDMTFTLHGNICNSLSVCFLRKSITSTKLIKSLKRV